MNKYFATYPHGFDDLVESLLKRDLRDVEIIEKWQSSIIFSAENRVLLSNHEYLESLHLLIHTYRPDLTSLFNWSENNSHKIADVISKSFPKRSTFRVVESAPNHDKSKFRHRVESLHEKLMKEGVKINKGSADYEIRLKVVKDTGFIGIRLSKPSEYIDQFQSGGIRKEIASLLIELTNPAETDMFMDPMCGSGLIPILRARKGKYREINALDEDITQIKEKIRKSNLTLHNFNLIKSNFLSLDVDLIKNKPNKIIIDPPWGYIQKIDDLENFYKSFLQKIIDITERSAQIVVITGSPEAFIEATISHNKSFLVMNIRETIVSGREASVFELKRL